MDQIIELDTHKREYQYGKSRIAPLRRGEKNNVLLTVKICTNGIPYDLSGKTASLIATTAADKLVGPYAIECADLDSEQAAEFTPLLGELQNAVAEEAKRVEAEKARVQAETERATGFAEAKQASQAATEAANDAAADANLAAGTASDAAKSANTAAGKATNAAAKAESDVRAFVDAAGTAVGDAIAAAREDVDAAVKRSDAATAKAEAAVKTADAANTAATQAVSDAQDAIAEVKATEAKLYPAAENILVGSETGAVAHVDDAFSGASLRKITVEGACKQDGIPSLESPKPITVIEHPAVKVVGRNLLRYKEGLKKETINGVTYTPLDDGGIKLKGLATERTSYYNVDFGGLAELRSAKAFAGKTWVIDKDISDNFVAGVQTESGDFPTVNSGKVPNDAATFRCFVYTRLGVSVNKTIYPAIYFQNLSDYKPYMEQSITFALPAEHPYLAKLPDSTADEIVVDGDGNVELVARVERVLPSDYRPLDFGDGGDGSAYVSLRKNHASISVNSLMCSSYTPSNPTIKSGSIYTPNYTNIVIRDDRFTSKDKAIELLDGVVVYTAVEPTRYPLGKIEIPKAQDSIVNVWTDAEVTPNTAIEYVRDVNIVVANIESAIASITEG